MNLTVTEESAKWYKEELNIQSPAFIRFFPRYGGCLLYTSDAADEG